MYKPVQTGRLYEQIAAQIEQQVVDGTLKAGDRLPAERELATRFGVSRTAVREAVKALRQRGLIEVYPGRGTFVTDGTSNALRQSLGLAMAISQQNDFEGLLELREIIEPAIAFRAAERATDAQLDTLGELVAHMDDVLNEPDAFISADFAFHLALAEATHNPILPTIMNSIVDLLQKQRASIFKEDGGQARAQAHHVMILRSVRGSDPDSAESAMVAHLQQIREDYEATLVATA